MPRHMADLSVVAVGNRPVLDEIEAAMERDVVTQRRAVAKRVTEAIKQTFG